MLRIIGRIQSIIFFLQQNVVVATKEHVQLVVILWQHLKKSTLAALATVQKTRRRIVLVQLSSAVAKIVLSSSNSFLRFQMEDYVLLSVMLDYDTGNSSGHKRRIIGNNNIM